VRPRVVEEDEVVADSAPRFGHIIVGAQVEERGGLLRLLETQAATYSNCRDDSTRSREGSVSLLAVRLNLPGVQRAAIVDLVGNDDGRP